MSIEKRENTGKIARRERKAHRQAVRSEIKARVAKDRSNEPDYYAAEKAGRWGGVGATFLPAGVVSVIDPVGQGLLLSIVLIPPLIMAAHTALYFDKSTYLYRLRNGEVQRLSASRSTLEERGHS